MPVAGAFAGRLQEVAISNDGGTTFIPIERVVSPTLSGSNETAETSSNDSAGNKEYIYTWSDATVSFQMVSDEAATGQEALWSVFLNRTIPILRCRPRSDLTGNKEFFFSALLTQFEQGGDKSDKGTYSVTFQRTGATTRQNQP